MPQQSARGLARPAAAGDAAAKRTSIRCRTGAGLRLGCRPGSADSTGAGGCVPCARSCAGSASRKRAGSSLQCAREFSWCVTCATPRALIRRAALTMRPLERLKGCPRRRTADVRSASRVNVGPVQVRLLCKRIVASQGRAYMQPALQRAQQEAGQDAAAAHVVAIVARERVPRIADARVRQAGAAAAASADEDVLAPASQAAAPL